MTSVPDLEKEVASARLVSQADGVLVLAYPGSTGGCGPQLIALLDELLGTLPVLIVQPETSDESGAGAFEGKGSKVKSIPSDPGQAQNAAVMSAMRQLTIKAPILILLNPLFIPFWERAFGIYRLFAVTEQFRDETEESTSAENEKDLEREKENQILLLERSVDSVLVEGDENLEWMRREFVYLGESHRIKDIVNSASTSLLELSKEGLSEQSRYPHRLDILVLIDELESGKNLPIDEAASLYQNCSRHHVYVALKRFDEGPAADGDVPDYSDFDVLLIDQSGRGRVNEKIEMRNVDGVKEFPGLKALIVAKEVGSDLEKTLTDLGIHMLILNKGLGEKGEGAIKLDPFISSLMPGLSNWQLHHAGKHLSCHAWTYEQLVELEAVGKFEPESQIAPIEELRLLEQEKQVFEGKLNCMREEMMEQDQEILFLKDELEKRNQRTRGRIGKKRHPNFIKRIRLKIMGEC